MPRLVDFAQPVGELREELTHGRPSAGTPRAPQIAIQGADGLWWGVWEEAVEGRGHRR